ncbi:Nn.00g013030.m01.CDS01 [Neocucurbitaria sp. VM-36]
MSGPVASNLVLLTDLGECEPGTKARFLGCVEEYIAKTATLRLKHDYPASSPPVIANVDIEHVLEQVKRQELDVGTWINVIGYVERRKENGIYVQAVVVWDAGNVDLSAYEKAVAKRKEAS